MRRRWFSGKKPRADEVSAARGLDTPMDLAEVRDPRLVRGFIAIIVATIVLALLWSSVTEIDQLTTGPGVVTTETEIVRVEHPFGGAVKDVLARVGDSVSDGETLLVFDQGSLRRQERSLDARMERLTTERARVLRIIEGETLSAVTFELSEMPAEDALFWSEQAFLQSQIDIIDAGLRSLSNRAENLDDRVAILSEEADLARARSDRLGQLVDAGAISAAELDIAERDRLRMEQQIVEAVGAAQGARDEIATNGLRRQELLSKRLLEAVERDLELTELIRSLEQERAEVLSRLDRTRVTAPVAGRVQTLAVSSSGDVVTQGELIAEIVPEGVPIRVRLEIVADQIGAVLLGAPVRLSINTFDFAWYGEIHGTVETISPTSFENAAGVTVYHVYVELDPPEVETNDQISQAALQPGMTVTGHIVGESRTILSYIFKPLRAIQNEAFTEA